jgi:hypothetical protein
MTAMTLRDFESDLGMLLRDESRGTTADLTDLVVAYWGGNAVVYAYLRDDEGGLIEEEFDPEDLPWNEWQTPFSAWLASPRFSHREEVARWLADAPPCEAPGWREVTGSSHDGS